jgi:hypothetical protein
MYRRQFVSALATGVAGGLAGCTALGLGEGNSTTLGVIEMINFSQVSNSVRVQVLRDGEEVMLDRFELAPFDAGVNGATRIIQPQWSMTPGRYTLDVTHYGPDGDRETNGEEYTFTSEDYESYYGAEVGDPGCIGAVVKIGSNAAERNAMIGISPTRIENPCGGRDGSQ